MQRDWSGIGGQRDVHDMTYSGSDLETKPPATLVSTTRRALLTATATAAAVGGIGLIGAGGAWAQPGEARFDGAAFLTLSKAVTGHGDLEAITAGRMLEAFRRAKPAFLDQAAALGRLVQHDQSPEALLAAAEASGLGDAMRELVSAWYTGTVGHGDNAEVVAYAGALMYRPVSDGLPVPTYCFNGPLWWNVPPPSADVSAPVAAPKGG
jgi:hypothetical protein